MTKKKQKPVVNSKTSGLDLKTKSLFLAGVTFLFFSMLFFSVKAPELHGNHLRDKVGTKVVEIHRSANGNQGVGTGFHVVANSGKTYILTNRHVCEAAAKDGTLYVRSRESNRILPKRVIDVYTTHDLCLVEPVVGVSGLKIGKTPRVGETVALIGHPRLNSLSLFKGEVISSPVIDIVMAYNTTRDKCVGTFVSADDNPMLKMFGIDNYCMESLITHMATYVSYSGSSGSPVVNFWGNVVGVHFAGARDFVYDSYMVPTVFIKTFLRDY